MSVLQVTAHTAPSKTFKTSLLTRASNMIAYYVLWLQLRLGLGTKTAWLDFGKHHTFGVNNVR